MRGAFVGALIWGERRLGPRYHFLAALAVALFNVNEFLYVD